MTRHEVNALRRIIQEAIDSPDQYAKEGLTNGDSLALQIVPEPIPASFAPKSTF